MARRFCSVRRQHGCSVTGSWRTPARVSWSTLPNLGRNRAEAFATGEWQPQGSSGRVHWYLYASSRKAALAVVTLRVCCHTACSREEANCCSSAVTLRASHRPTHCNLGPTGPYSSTPTAPIHRLSTFQTLAPSSLLFRGESFAVWPSPVHAPPPPCQEQNPAALAVERRGTGMAQKSATWKRKDDRGSPSAAKLRCFLWVLV